MLGNPLTDCLLVLLIILGSCQQQNANQPPSATHKLGAAANGQTVQVQAGDVIELRLDSNPTTGYSWADLVFDTTLVSLAAEGFDPPSGQGELTGAGGVQWWRFLAYQPGRTELRLSYRRPWEKDKPASDVFVVHLVTSALT